jgi:glycerol-3-phosphate dehydrogenase
MTDLGGAGAPGIVPDRAAAWSRLAEPWDVLVIGGGITGASLHAEATRRGLRSLLLEGRDFASGASGHSGQLVHGGMRYLSQGRVAMTRALLRERDRLLATHPGLIEPLSFVLPTYRDHPLDRVKYGVGVRLYDLLRGHRRSWRRLAADEVAERIPGVRAQQLDGGFLYGDAVTDDARLVLRQLRMAARGGGVALNYARVAQVQRDRRGAVVGAEVVDGRTGASGAVRATVVVNATGADADALRRPRATAARLRPIRGTHLVLPRQRFPLQSAIGYRHPATGRHQYMLPWDEVVLVGTTDVDGGAASDGAVRATAAEITHLVEGVQHCVPEASLARDDVIAAYAGVRPVADQRGGDPSQASRHSVVWEEDGLLTVISGKLTGFQSVIAEAMRRIAPRLGARAGTGAGPLGENAGVTDGHRDMTPPAGVTTEGWRRVVGRHGADASAMLAAARPGELDVVPGTRTLWVELRWGARAEGVEHLDDLLLRRTRIGMQRPPEVAADPRLEAICRAELGWDAARCAAELSRYQQLWTRDYSVSQ